MIRISSSWGVALLLAAIFASEVVASSAPAAQSAWQRRSNPYSSLFQPAPLVKPGEHTQAMPPPPPAKPKVVCGMTVIPADPRIDPKFTIAPPDRQTKYTIRAIEPPICKP
jgi:hypothetical protein